MRIGANGLYVESSLLEKGIEREWFLSELAKKLPDVQVESKPVFRNVWRREQLYEGPWVEALPDLIYTTTEDFVVWSGGLKKLGTYLRILPGAHWDCPDGILLMSGGKVKPGRIDASIYDIAPTVLHIFGIPLDDGLDGRELINAETDGLAKVNEQAETRTQATFTPEEEDVLKKRLRNLGYI